MVKSQRSKANLRAVESPNAVKAGVPHADWEASCRFFVEKNPCGVSFFVFKIVKLDFEALRVATDLGSLLFES